MDYMITVCDGKKRFLSEEYNYQLDTKTGNFYRWGRTFEDDPVLSPYGPEIADIEISTGDCSGKCPWCYKANETGNGHHMTLATFKKVLDNLPRTLTQVALGLTDLDSNPDLIPIMEYCHECGVMPNFTTAGFGCDDLHFVANVASLAGAVAVSVYPHTKDRAYNTVRMFLDSGVEQTNIHLLYYQENKDFVYEVLGDVKKDPRLDGLNAVVLLGLKPKGRAEGGKLTPFTQEEFTSLAVYCSVNHIPMGFDSCSAAKFDGAIDSLPVDSDTKEIYRQCSERCESGLFSIYVARGGNVYPCSFTEDKLDWWKPVNLAEVEDFYKEVWHTDQMNRWRKMLLNNCRQCPVYKIG